VDINPGGLHGGSAGQYFVGTFDGKRFVSDEAKEKILWADYGMDFYASLSYSDLPKSDPRRIWIGWVSNWLYANEEPTSPWRGVQSIPRTLGLRRLPEGLRLVQSPVVELEKLRKGAARTVTLSGELPGSADIELEVARGDFKEAGLRLSNRAGEEVTLGVSGSPLELFVDRRKSRLEPFHEKYPGRHAGPLRWRADRVKLRVLFDRTTLEVFANDGETVVTERVYPTKPLTRLEVLGGGRGLVGPVRVFEVASVWP
jgi:sucrose-6-phosphate hydrolase SacC (GH32 family)